MAELLIKYTNPKVKEALTDFSKYLDFTIEKPRIKKAIKRVKQKDDTLLEQIKKGLADVKKIRNGEVKAKTIKEMLNEK
jgi:hypothetical protein